MSETIIAERRDSAATEPTSVSSAGSPFFGDAVHSARTGDDSASASQTVPSATASPGSVSRIRETSRDYAHPYRPFPLGAANAAGRGLARIGIRRSLDAGAIIKAAARDAGMPRGFAGIDQSYREGLDVLVDSIETEADLNPVGRLITRGRLIGVLRARFRAEAILEAEPGILDAPLAPPIVITGLQRTGTTLLHRVIAADRRFRSLSSWEVIDPAPPAPGRRGTDPRVRAARRAEQGAAWMSPDFFAVHPIDHMAPEEDVLLLDGSFRSTVAEAILRVPAYAAWLEQADSTPAYAFMRRLLLLFQSRDQRPLWILKTPHHLEFLDTLFAVFPEARVIQGHRDPSKTMGSFLSMVAHGHGMFTDHPDPMEIGRRWTRKCRRMTDRGMAYRASLAPEQESRLFKDIAFDQLVHAPLEALEDLYRFIGLPFDAEAEASARRLLERHGRYRYGRHVYHLADFGFTAEGIREEFADYRERYAVSDED